MAIEVGSIIIRINHSLDLGKNIWLVGESKKVSRIRYDRLIPNRIAGVFTTDGFYCDILNLEVLE